MNATRARRYRIALASLALAGLYCGTAGAAGVSERNIEDMNHWYGRAGGAALPDAVSEANAPQEGKSVTVGVPANSGSLLYDDAGGGIRSKPHVRSETGQPTASLQQEAAPSNQH